MNRFWTTSLMALATVITGACEEPRPTAGSYTPLRQRSVSPATAFAAAEQALGERFPIETRDPQSGLLTTAAVDSRAAQASRRFGDVLSTPRRVRKTARVRVEPAGDGVNIWCKVIVEENETGAHALFAQEHSLSDIPSDTPADRDGATTTEQNSVWRYKGRDRRLEREIRRAIQELLTESSVP